MQQLIDELKAIPGVVGACVYSSREGLQLTNLPGIFKVERLAAVGKQLAKLHAAGRMNFADLTDFSLHYDESVVVTRELQKGLLVFAVCDPAVNQNLLTMSFNLLQEEFRDGGFAKTAASIPAAADAAVTPGDEVELEPALATLLESMRRRLGKVLGPMAGYIFDEAVEIWQQAGACGARLDKLLEQLDGEMADVQKSRTYRQLIAAELRAFQEG